MKVRAKKGKKSIIKESEVTRKLTVEKDQTHTVYVLCIILVYSYNIADKKDT